MSAERLTWHPTDHWGGTIRRGETPLAYVQIVASDFDVRELLLERGRAERQAEALRYVLGCLAGPDADSLRFARLKIESVLADQEKEQE